MGRGLCFDVDGRRVLDEVSVEAEPGRMLAVTGTSGSGKTTLLSLVGGLAEPSAGQASYDGGPVTTKQGEPLPGTGFVLQSYGLVPTLTAAENVAVALPILIGIFLGAEAVAGMLMVGTISGVMLATVLNNGGGAWDNAKKYIESGHLLDAAGRRSARRPTPTPLPSSATRSAIRSRTRPARRFMCS